MSVTGRELLVRPAGTNHRAGTYPQKALNSASVSGSFTSVVDSGGTPNIVGDITVVPEKVRAVDRL
ncbi:hypothetical protein [Nocardia brevicatena]|uniref:hypothetical protein n=1 Tax=Nocardia brevicatena TaxID=37327 RepID=UPI000309FEC9|nr:hypothetical protein [Nocardia brevicatena]